MEFEAQFAGCPAGQPNQKHGLPPTTSRRVDTEATHLAVDADGKLNVNGTALYEELLAAMSLYADYLDANTEQGGPGTLS